MAEPMNLVRGTVDILILNAVSGTTRHGYDVVSWIREASDDALNVDDGALYTSLHRMEKRGWLDAEWGVSPRGRRAKYYRLTDAGRKQLERGESHWLRYAEAVSKIFAARRAQEA
ncbi:MAG: PadR family transcriptional regulator [Thermoanaerobaculia bacterium]|nr:PadR family transcriptional regulator [Thermoanaerobaculia bacterium]